MPLDQNKTVDYACMDPIKTFSVLRTGFKKVSNPFLDDKNSVEEPFYSVMFRRALLSKLVEHMCEDSRNHRE
jgi:hypothetical protein